MASSLPDPKALLADIACCVGFYTRLPIPYPGERDFATAQWAAPVAGAVVGLVIGVTLWLSLATGLPATLAAAIALAAGALLTGALHEDGLADVADGFGGGQTRERKLEIMKDSRVGAFGVCALILAFALRIGALVELLAAGPLQAAAGLAAAVSVARLAGLWMLAALPFARADGLARSAGVPGRESRRRALVLALLVAGLLVIPTLGVMALIGGALAGLAAFFLVVRLARAQFGGQTGDVAGAATLLVEIAFLIGLLILAR